MYYFYKKLVVVTILKPKIWGKEWGGRSLWSNYNSSSKGVAILFKENFTFDFQKIESNCKYDGRFISADIKLAEDKIYRISCVYAPNSAKEWKTFSKDLEMLLIHFSHSMHVVGGDYNCTQNYKLDRRSDYLMISRIAGTSTTEVVG